jgi:hypothetical protein
MTIPLYPSTSSPQPSPPFHGREGEDLAGYLRFGGLFCVLFAKDLPKIYWQKIIQVRVRFAEEEETRNQTLRLCNFAHQFTDK